MRGEYLPCVATGGFAGLTAPPATVHPPTARLARLARPDMSKAINDLTANIHKWSKNDDKRLCRLMCYMQSSKHDKLLVRLAMAQTSSSSYSL